MSYYDGTVGWYDSQINNNRTAITNCNKQIQGYEDDIDELNRLKSRVTDVDKAVVTAAKNSTDKIINLPAVITNPFSLLKMNFFSNFLEMIKGPEHTRARRSLSNAVTKIDDKINALKKEIEILQGQIQQYNGKIDTLSIQRRNYIAQATAPKPQPQPESQPAAKEEVKTEKKTTAKSSSSKSTKSSKSSSKKKKK